jgi:hypothetical protein
MRAGIQQKNKVVLIIQNRPKEFFSIRTEHRLCVLHWMEEWESAVALLKSVKADTDVPSAEDFLSKLPGLVEGEGQGAFDNDAFASLFPAAFKYAYQLEQDSLRDYAVLKAFVGSSRINRFAFAFLYALEHMYDDTDKDISQSRAFQMTHYAEPSFTRRKLQRPDENREMWNQFMSFDPDCVIREQEHLISNDEMAQKNLLGLFWKATSGGKDFPNSDQHWRKISLDGRGAPFNESIFTRFENVSLWKRSCQSLAHCVC